MLTSLKKLAEQWEVSESLLYQLVEKGKLSCVRIGAGRGVIRFRKSDIDEYLRNAEARKTDAEARLPNRTVRKTKLRHLG